MPYQSGIPYIDTLLSNLQPHWQGAGVFNTPTVVTFSFVESGSVYNASTSSDIEIFNFSPFSIAQRTATREILNQWSSVANITFVEVADTLDSHGDIRLLNTNDILQNGAAGTAYLPILGVGEDRQSDFNEVLGDIFIAPGAFNATNLSEFGFGRFLLAHEIGHAIGLTHPNSDDSLGVISAAENNDRYTVMTTSETSSDPYVFGNSIQAAGPMLYDIAAIQHLYGANLSYNSGNTVYTFLRNDPQIRVIWDGGGIDTFDMSDQQNPVNLTLNQGSYNTIYPDPDNPDGLYTGKILNNIGIAFGVVIENAIGGYGNDIITGNSANNHLQGGSIFDYSSDQLNGADGNDFLQGGGGNDLLIGGNGNDILEGGEDVDTLQGGSGDDYYIVDHLDTVFEAFNQGHDTIETRFLFTLPDNVEDLVITAAGTGTGNQLANRMTGGASNDMLYGMGGNDTLIGGAGNDLLDGGSGNDFMSGGSGDDTYYIDGPSDVVVEELNQGFDELYTPFNYIYAAQSNIERVILLPGSATSITGNDNFNFLVGNENDNFLNGLGGLDVLYANGGNDTLKGGAGDDILDGGAGNDLMEGGAGDDTYYIDTLEDILVETANGGTDMVISRVDFILPDHLENLTLDTPATSGYGNDADNLIVGNPMDNYLEGGAGNDVIDGHLGIDTMVGGAGNDSYHLNGAADIVIEDVGGGIDTVYIYTTGYILPDNVENLMLYGGTSAGTGNELNNSITGLMHFNLLYGLAGNDILDGGEGPDIMVGGPGNDTYYMDFTWDEITENAGEGIDHLYTAFSFTLPENFEQLTLLDMAGSVAATGNAVDNLVRGNIHDNLVTGLAGHDHLYGMQGNDTLMGDDGNDYLYGGTGDDYLNGGTGNDMMEGGAGNDIYLLDSPQDKAIEEANSGLDLVLARFNFSLGDASNIEDLALAEDGQALSASGNLFANVITGNSFDNVLNGMAGDDEIAGLGGNDVLVGGRGVDVLDGGPGSDRLDGGQGNDYMAGGEGSDTYVIRRGDGAGNLWTGMNEDQIFELNGQGNDTVESHVYTYTLPDAVEKIVLTGPYALKAFGNQLNNTLTGNAGDNLLVGGGGNDILAGGNGNDRLSGDEGNDVLSGQAGIDVLFGGDGADRFVFSDTDSIDWVFDFTGGLNQDKLVLSTNVFAGITGTNSVMNEGFLQSGAVPLAQDANDHILYNTISGALFYDPDGNGSTDMIQFAVLSGAPVLTTQDFLLQA